jgi:hypothetical protein
LLSVQRQETERIAREEAARLELERQAKIKRDEEEKIERKKVIIFLFQGFMYVLLLTFCFAGKHWMKQPH